MSTSRLLVSPRPFNLFAFFPHLSNLKYTKAIESVGENPPMSDTLLACYNNRAACHQQLGNYEAVVEDSTWVLEHDVGV